MPPVRRVLIANRGEIAVRIAHACRKAGVECVAAVSDADRSTLVTRLADRVICIGPAPARDSYLRPEVVVHAALATGCDALHPGYGFLSERAELAALCEANGVRFVGPTADTIRSMGNKLAAREAAARCGVPLLPGSQAVESVAEAQAVAERVGYPVLLKAAGGGGGRGMKVIRTGSDLAVGLETARAEAQAAFGDPTVYLERFIDRARHVEVQIIGDGTGRVVHLGERDCSTQRRYQKLIEEAPAPSLAPRLVDAVRRAAVTLAAAARYRSAGTLEFLVDPAGERFYFLEMNTRIQVEHPVSEAVTGVDLVAEQLRLAGGGALGLSQHDVVLRGHAVEVRLNAEAPAKGFRPSPGRITEWSIPALPGLRVDTHCYAGYVVPPFYDSLLAKVIAWGETRDAALALLSRALGAARIEGIDTTLDFARRLIRERTFLEGSMHTRWAEELTG